MGKESFLLKIVNKFREKNQTRKNGNGNEPNPSAPRRCRGGKGRNCSSQFVRWRHRYWRFGEEYARSARHGQDPVRATRQVRQWRALCPGDQRRGDHLEIVRR